MEGTGDVVAQELLYNLICIQETNIILLGCENYFR